MAKIEDVAGVLKNHSGPYCTLNRLWLKHHKSKIRREKFSEKYSDEIVRDAPELNRSNTKIETEMMTTEYLYELAGDGTRVSPKRDDAPVVIVRFRENDYLIDGGSRSRKWNKENNDNLHEAYIVTVQE